MILFDANGTKYMADGVGNFCLDYGGANSFVLRWAPHLAGISSTV